MADTAAAGKPMISAHGAGVLATAVVASAGLTASFRGPRPRFWDRMTVMSAVTGLMGFAIRRPQPDPATARLDVRRRARDIVIGLGVAAVQVVAFQVGEPIARRVLPTAARDLDAIYGLRDLEPRIWIGLRLAACIVPAEELVWRGVVQNEAGRMTGPVPGALLGTGLYAAAHLPTGNPTLVLAALAGGGQWALLRAAGVSGFAVTVSHLAWDIYLFLMRPR